MATWEQLDELSETILDGKTIDKKTTGFKPVTITFGKNGLMLTRVNPAADQFDRSQKSVPAIQSMPVPDKPVKVGESWTAKVPNQTLKNDVIAVKSTLVGVEKVLGVDALKIQAEFKFATTFGAMESEIVKVQETYYLDAKSFELLRASYTIKDPMLPFPGKEMVARVLVSRRLPGVNDASDPEGEQLLVVKKP